MIREFAIDPALLPRWTGLTEYRYIVGHFGLGEPRVMAEFPSLKNWRRQALQAASAMGDLQQQRLTALVAALGERVAPRSPAAPYDGTRTWIANAHAEHAAHPFAAVMTVPPVDPAAGVIDGTLPAVLGQDSWQCGRTECVARSAAAIVRVAAPLLRPASRILLVDPYFRANRPQYRNTFRGVLREIAACGRLPLVEVHASADHDMAPSAAEYRRECETLLRQLIPAGLDVRFVRWMSRTNDQVLHNRYILTDFGGLSFGHGLDEGAPGETDDVTLLERTHYVTRWAQYRTAGVFTLADEFRL